MDKKAINQATGRPRFSWRKTLGPAGVGFRASIAVYGGTRGFASFDASITANSDGTVNLSTSNHGALDRTYTDTTQAKNAAGKRADQWFLSRKAKNDRHA